MTSENLPDPAAEAGQERLSEQIARTGMFGTETTGDTSGYGGLRVRRAPVPSSPRPYGSYFDEVADRLADGMEREGPGFDEAIERVIVDRGELTLHVRREHLAGGGEGAAGRAIARLRAVPRGERRALPLGGRPGAARRLRAAVDHPQPAPAAGGERARRGSPRAVAGEHLPDL